MKKLLQLLCMAAVAAPVAASAQVLPAGQIPIDWPKQYVAETASTMMGTRAQGKLYVDGDKVRSENNVSGNQTIAIMRPDKKVMYSVMPAQKMYMEMAYTEQMTQADPVKAKGTWEQVGNEVINDQTTTKYKVTTDYNGQKTSVYFWVNKEKLPVRMATEDGRMTTDYVSIKKETPDANLFEPPTGYTKMETPAMPGMPGSKPGASAVPPTQE